VSRAKGIVLETTGNRATILTNQGEYKKVKINGPIQVGEIWQEPSGFIWKYACAAAVLLLVVAGGIDFLSVTAYARVSSGVELGLNRWDRVVSVKGLDNNSKNVLHNINLKGKSVENAVKILAQNKLYNPSSQVTVITEDNKIKQRVNEKIQKIPDTINHQKTKQNEAGSNLHKKNGKTGPAFRSNNKGSAGAQKESYKPKNNSQPAALKQNKDYQKQPQLIHKPDINQEKNHDNKGKHSWQKNSNNSPNLHQYQAGKNQVRQNNSNNSANDRKGKKEKDGNKTSGPKRDKSKQKTGVNRDD
jgi:hypothetical protein